MKNTIIGFESFLGYEHISLFDYLPTPEGLDRNTLIEKILIDSGEFEALYYDPHILRELIGVWGRAMFPTFSKWVKALDIEYDPLVNYDRVEESKRNVSGMRDTKTNSNSISSTEVSGSITTTGSDTGTSTEQVSAFNSDNFADSSKSSNTATSSNITDSDNETKVSADNTLNDSSSEKSEDAFFSHVKGNIGVTTSQQMLKAELDIATWNIYVHISDLFLKEFCLLVY